METQTFTALKKEWAGSPETRAIAEHKWHLSERLGRDVGAKVAELDYRLNIQKEAAAENTNWFFTLLERLAAAQGMRAMAEVQYASRTLPFAPNIGAAFQGRNEKENGRTA